MEFKNTKIKGYYVKLRPGVSGTSRYPTSFASTGTTMPAPWNVRHTLFLSRAFIAFVLSSSENPPRFASSFNSDCRFFRAFALLLLFFNFSSTNQLQQNE